VRTLDPTFHLILDHAAALRAADADLCRALAELQGILDRQEPGEAGLQSDDFKSDWVRSLSVVRDALQAVERIASLLAAAAADADRRGS
jgi:hypothetical protein